MYKIGIDIGGTNIKLGIVDERNRIIRKHFIKTNTQQSSQVIIERLGKAILTLIKLSQISTEKISGVGIGCPGTIDRENGIVVYSNNIHWEDLKLATSIEKIVKLPVKLANDADCAVLGEQAAGRAQGKANVVLLTLGTGVGSGIIVDGHLLTGGYFGGGELGHMVLDMNGPRCSCGRQGCFEVYASAAALMRTGKKIARSNKESLLYKANQEKQRIHAKMVFEAMDAGDLAAKKAVDQYMKYLAAGIVNVINIFRPQIILLGGGVSERGDSLIQMLEEQVENQCFGNGCMPKTEIAIAALKNNAGIIGAAQLVDLEV